MPDSEKIPGGAFLLAEVRGDGFAALDNFLLRDWPTRINLFVDNLPGSWSAKLPVTGIDNAASLVVLKAPQWAATAAPTLGEAKRMLSDLVGGVGVKSLTLTGNRPATTGELAAATESAKSNSPFGALANFGELLLALVVVGGVVALVVASERAK